MPAIFFTVTNDLSYDQRMIRICTSLSGAGYDVTLVGRKKRNSVDLKAERFKQVRLPCFLKQVNCFTSNTTSAFSFIF